MAKTLIPDIAARIRSAGLTIEEQACKVQILLGLALELLHEGGGESPPPEAQRRVNSLSCLLECALQAAETAADFNEEVIMLSASIAPR